MCIVLTIASADGYLPLLYHTPILAFTALSQFQTFSTTIAPASLQLIRHLEFYVELGMHEMDKSRIDQASYDDDPKRLNLWQQAWKTISTLPNLRTLKVELICAWDNYHNPPRTTHMQPEVEERMLAAMRDVGNVKEEFLVEVNWPQSEGFDLGNVAFELRRCVERRQSRGKTRMGDGSLLISLAPIVTEPVYQRGMSYMH